VERSFKREVQQLRLGANQVFRGEGIVAVAKALLQSGVSYVGGYQGSPVSHVMDVLVDAEDIMAELGVHLETNANEAAAAAMLGASINYPMRGAVGWKSVVGSNVAADALSNLASPGVIGGAMIISGEDYGEGASVIQERTYAFALKSGLCLIDPRASLPTIVRLVEEGFALSEASNCPVVLQMRIRSCHMQGKFVCKDNVAPAIGTRRKLAEPAGFDFDRLSHPPATYRQEKRKLEQRMPAARRFVVERGLNEILDGELGDIGIVVTGGLADTVLRRLARIGLADGLGGSRVPMLILNVTYPLVPEQIAAFCAGKRAVLTVEEGSPEYIEQQINVILRKADLQTRVHGKDVLPGAGEYTAEALDDGLAGFLRAARPVGYDLNAVESAAARRAAIKAKGRALVPVELPPRPPAHCTGCPERPVFSAIKLLEREIGKVHVAADIGCHSFAIFAPFNLGHSILGYGMGLASAAAVAPMQQRRPIAIMGDGGFWHNGLQTGVIGTQYNRGDSVLVIMQNGFTSATGQQYLPSSTTSRFDAPGGMDIRRTLEALGIGWLRTVRTYSIAKMVATLREAMATAYQGLKVIIADGECMLARQRRLRIEVAERLKQGLRVARARFGVDEEICTGDHSCIRLSGCPSLTVKTHPDPLRTDPVAHVVQSCVGCGVCGEVAHAAVLCPSFYRAEIVRNPGRFEAWRARFNRRAIGWLAA